MKKVRIFAVGNVSVGTLQQKLGRGQAVMEVLHRDADGPMIWQQVKEGDHVVFAGPDSLVSIRALEAEGKNVSLWYLDPNGHLVSFTMARVVKAPGW